jgi:alpha-aminoadipate/glutamate carrier protein LysW
VLIIETSGAPGRILLEVNVSYCPECEAVIEDEEFEDVGEVISCPECGVELEVISIDPVEFDLAPVDEDDDDFEFDDSDDEEEWDEEEYDEEEEEEEE